MSVLVGLSPRGGRISELGFCRGGGWGVMSRFLVILGSWFLVLLVLSACFLVLCFYNGLFLVLIFGRFWAWWDWVGILEWLVPWATYLSVEVFAWLVWIVGGL